MNKVPVEIAVLEDMLGEVYAALREDTGVRVGGNPYEAYQGLPLEFCRDILGVPFFTEDAEEMILSAQENPATLAKSSNAVGKTFAAACFAIYWYLCYTDSQVYTAAAPPEDNLKLLLWGEIGAIVEKNPHLFIGHRVSLTSMKIYRNSKSFMVGLAIPQSADPQQIKARFSGKHAPRLLFVFDEGDGVPDAVYEAAESCMSGGEARLVSLYNPRAESGPTYRMEKEGEGRVINLRTFAHPNVVTGRDVIPGAVSRQQTIRRIALWTVPLTDKEKPGPDCFKVPDFLVGTVPVRRDGTPLPALRAGYRRVIDPAFSYMVLGEYPAQAENQLISRAWVDAAVSRWKLWSAQYGPNPPSGARPVMGYDVAEEGMDSNCVTLKYGSWIGFQTLWRGVDSVQGGDRAADIYLQNAALWANVDATGVGNGAYAQMKRRGCEANRIMVGSKEGIDKKSDIDTEWDVMGFDRIRSQMLWGLREWLRTDTGAMLPPVQDLIDELLAPTYCKNLKEEITVCKTDLIKSKIRRSPDRLMSLALLFAKQPKAVGSPVYETSYIQNGNGKKRRYGLALH